MNVLIPHACIAVYAINGISAAALSLSPPSPPSLSLSRSHSFSLPFGNKRNAGNRKIRVYRVSRAGNVLLFPAAMRVVQEKRTRVPNKKIAHAKFFKFLINVLTKGGTDFLIGS